MNAPAVRLGIGQTLLRAFWLCVAGAMPALAVVYLLLLIASGDLDLPDFRTFFSAAEDLLRGESPYPGFVYPPLTAIAVTPFALLPYGVAKVVVAIVLGAGVVATLRILGVRDWRCYGVAFLWPPVFSAIQTGNITILLGLGAALAWRYREREYVPAVSIGVTLAAKFFLWPLVFWLAATHRARTAARAVIAGAVVLVLSWAVIGFSGVTEYIDVVRGVQRVVESDTYTVRVVALDMGMPAAAARATWLLVGLGLLVSVIAFGRRGDDRRAFVLAIAAALALSPIVWLHYFELLLVAVAVARPRIGLVWFVPLAMFVTPGSGDPTPFETSATLLTAFATVVLAVHAASRAPTDDEERSVVGITTRTAPVDTPDMSDTRDRAIPSKRARWAE